MNRRDVLWTVAYYVVVAVALWWFGRDPNGPTVRASLLYHTHRAARTVARVSGTIGLAAESAYYREVEHLHT